MNKPLFKTLPPNCRIVGEEQTAPKRPQPAARLNERPPAAPMPPPPAPEPATVTKQAESLDWLRHYRIATFDFQNGCDRLVWTGVPKDLTPAFVAHCQTFKPE